MTTYTPELVFFLLGLVGNFIVAALYDRYKSGRSARAEALRRDEEQWHARLTSSDGTVRAVAFEELIFQCLRWFILGNVMFGISGITWILEFAELYPLSNALASITSIIAVILFGRSLAWIKLYFRHRSAEAPVKQTGAWA